MGVAGAWEEILKVNAGLGNWRYFYAQFYLEIFTFACVLIICFIRVFLFLKGEQEVPG